MRYAMAVAMVLAVAACDKSGDGATTTQVTATPTDAHPTTDAHVDHAVAPAAVGSDAQVLATIRAVNQGEVDQAKAAQPKLTNDDAKSFAETMAKQHFVALQKLSSVADSQHLESSESEASSHIKSMSEQHVSRLTGASPGPGYDREYMRSQVEEHTAALDLIDNKLIPATTNKELKDALSAMRTDVQEHLDKAKSVLQELPPA